MNNAPIQPSQPAAEACPPLAGDDARPLPASQTARRKGFAGAPLGNTNACMFLDPSGRKLAMAKTTVHMPAGTLAKGKRLAALMRMKLSGFLAGLLDELPDPAMMPATPQTLFIDRTGPWFRHVCWLPSALNAKLIRLAARTRCKPEELLCLLIERTPEPYIVAPDRKYGHEAPAAKPARPSAPPPASAE